jgi:hypothetical protein
LSKSFRILEAIAPDVGESNGGDFNGRFGEEDEGARETAHDRAQETESD